MTSIGISGWDSSAFVLKALVPSSEEAGAWRSREAGYQGAWPRVAASQPHVCRDTGPPHAPPRSLHSWALTAYPPPQIEGHPLSAKTTSLAWPHVPATLCEQEERSLPWASSSSDYHGDGITATCQPWTAGSTFKLPQGLSWEDHSQLFCSVVLFFPVTTFQSSRNSSERSGPSVAPFTLYLCWSLMNSARAAAQHTRADTSFCYSHRHCWRGGCAQTGLRVLYDRLLLKQEFLF